ncbi:MAG: FAD-dependent oxidoreductase [Rubrivivax sp.]|nr:FAD-dependent oxidoreductase [Rubrivivax sp.]
MKQLVLVGAGHAHALLLRDWARSPPPGVSVTVVSPEPLAPYSGMVPGWLAGAYRFDEIVVDFPRLCAAAGAHWLQDGLQALDPARRELRLASGARLGYEWLSLNVGSTLRPPSLPGTVLSLRPLSALRSAWEPLLQAPAPMATLLSPRPAAEARELPPLRLAAVGAGAAGFESLLAVLAQCRQRQPGRHVHAQLIGRGQALLPGLGAVARGLAQRALLRAGATLQLGVEDGVARAAQADLVLWATGALAQAWQTDPERRGSLAVSAEGFVRIDEQLRSVSHPEIFAVGDCAQAPEPLPKAGVFAVRMGPVLAHNLRAAMAGQPLQAYRPQRRFLALLATGDGRAIASRGALAAAGRWAWHWKDHIDRGFLRRLQG